MKKNRFGQFSIPIIIMAGISFQLITLFVVIDTDKLFWPDPNHYYSIAKDLYEGNPYSTFENERNLYRSPGYPFVLSLMMRIVGTNIMNLRLFHIALYPIFLVLLYKLGASWKNQRVGVIAMLFGAIYPPFIYIPLTFYPASLLIYLFSGIGLLIFYLKERMNYLYVILLAVMISLAIMIRPTTIFLIPVALVYLLRAKGYNMKKTIAIGTIITLLPTFTVASWVVRNKIVHNTFIFSTAGSISLLMSYNENWTLQTKGAGEFPKNIQKRLSTATNAAEKDKIYIDEAIKFISNHPLKASKMAFIKMLDLWNPIPHTITKGGFSQLKYKIVNAIPFLCFLILGIVGIIIERKDIFVQSLLLLMVFNTIINGFFMVSMRYRVVTDFAFIIMASFVVDLFLTKSRKSGCGLGDL